MNDMNTIMQPLLHTMKACKTESSLEMKENEHLPWLVSEELHEP